MSSSTRNGMLTLALIALAPILIVAKPRPGNSVSYLVPLSCFPIPVLASGTWPSPSSAATVAAFFVAVACIGVATRLAATPPWWQGALPLAALSLPGWVLLLVSFGLLGSGLIALIWSGIATSAWNLILLWQVRSVTPGITQAVLSLWLVAGLLAGLGGALFGIMAGLCC